MNSRQHYRKNVSLIGEIFIKHVEYDVHIQNISISGALIYIDSSSSLYDEPDMFMLIQYLSIIDIYIASLELTSKAEIIHVSFDTDHLLLGLKFKRE